MDKIGIINKFCEKRLVVIGDLMLDEFIYGDIHRMSVEAPVPIINFVNKKNFLGGAGNVANNVASLGAKTFVVGVIGEDTKGKEILKIFNENNINCDGVFFENQRKTTLKKRIICNSQQLLRLDEEDVFNISKDTEDRIINYLEKIIPTIDGIIVSDYAKGVMTEKIISEIIRLTKENNKMIFVDTKPINASFYKDVTLVKPNAKEAFEITGEKDFKLAGKKLLEIHNSNILITLGKEGMYLITLDGKETLLQTKAREVFDVTGAGDTVIALLGLSIISGADILNSVEIANIGAGIVVGKKGVVVLSPDELKKEISLFVVPKVWGEEHWIVNENYCGKKLILKKGFRCSMHKHKLKDETFYITKGKVLLELKDTKKILCSGDSQRIKPEEFHRFTGLEDSEIIEFSTHHEDNDSYRIEESGVADLEEINKNLENK